MLMAVGSRPSNRIIKGNTKTVAVPITIKKAFIDDGSTTMA